MSESTRMLGADKLLAHADRIAAWRAGGMPPPVTVELDLTNVCNHACPDCTFSHLINTSRDEIPLPLARGVIDELAEFGVKAVTFSGGGEPLVYGESRVVDLVAQVVNAGMDAALITNGSLLRSHEFLDYCEWVRVSVDAYDAETFRRFHGRGPAEFARVETNLRAFCQAAKLRKMQGIECATVGVGFLTDEGSAGRNDYWKMAHWCAGIDGLDYVQFRPLVENMIANPTLTGGYSASRRSELKHVRSFVDMARLSWQRADFRVLSSEDKYDALSRDDLGKTFDRCWGSFLQATISADGKVYLCCHTQGQDRYCLGDLHRDTFAGVWHSRQAKAVRERVRPQAECPPACRLHPQNVTLQELTMVKHANFI